jgi:hypothetical protein
MVNGRAITSRLSVGLPKPEIRRPIGSGETELGQILAGVSTFCVGFTSEMARSGTNIMMSSPNESSLPTDPSVLYDVRKSQRK